MLGNRKGHLARWLAGAVGVCGMFLSACSSSASSGNSGAMVTLNPASGSTSSTPTWSTSVACPSGFQGSAIFREVHSDGTTNSISQTVDGTVSPFGGKLEASIAQIQAIGGIHNGATQKYVVLCFSERNLVGKSDPEMTIYVTYSADGSSYTSSSTP